MQKQNTTEGGGGCAAETVVERIRKGLCTLFGRDDSPWTYVEQTQLAEITRRPRAEAEFQELWRYRERMVDKKFFPHTLGKLLERWTDTLDMARRANGYDPEENMKKQEIKKENEFAKRLGIAMP